MEQIREVAYGSDYKSDEEVCVKQFGGRNEQSPNPQAGGKPVETPTYLSGCIGARALRARCEFESHDPD